MASIFKRRGAKRFHIEFRDTRGLYRRILGFKDRTTTKELANKIERAVAIRQGGGVLAGEMLQWLEGLPSEMLEKLAEWEVIDPQRAAAGTGLEEHINNWRMFSLAKGNGKGYVKENAVKIKRLANACNWKSLSDIDGSSFLRWSANVRAQGKISTQTVNHYLRALRTFCNWLVENRLVSESPVRFVRGLNVKTDRRYLRRALTADEVNRLIVATEAGKQHHGLSGHQRALVYRLAVESGLRYSEIRSLTRASFDFNSNPATVTIAAKDEKARRGDTLSLREDLAADLKAYLALHLPIAHAFPLWESKGASMIKRDLKVAGIVYEDEGGRIVDFHALRTTLGSLLNLSGVPLKTAQDIMRHSDPKLTANFYTLTTAQDRVTALNKLPALDGQHVENKKDKAISIG